MKLRALVTALGLALLAAAPAQAADPASGEVTTSSPSTTWTGTINDITGAYDTVFWYFGAMPACEQPFCDTFELTVGPGGTSLSIRVAGGDGADNVAFEIEDPDGEYVYVDSEDTELRPTRERTFDAKPGEWVIRISGSGWFDYEGSATLSGGGGGSQPQQQQQAPPPPSGGGQPPAEQAPPPPPGDSGSAAPAPSVTVKSPSRKARSARKLRKGRSLAVGVTTSAPLRDVTAVLTPARGPKVLGSGRVASLSGSGTVRVKLSRSIKPGRYVIVVRGVDEQGRRVQASRAIRVTR